MGKSDLKPVICILNPDDKYYLQRDSNCIDSLPYCVTINDVRDLKKQGVEISDNLCKENIILTQLPGQKKYIFRRPEDENSMIENRIKKIGDILSYLGAKSCVISFSSKSKADMDSHVGVGVDVDAKGKVGVKDSSIEKGVDVNAQVDVNKSYGVVSEKNLLSENQWPGSYSEEGYKRAKEIALESALDEDLGIISMLEQRNPCHPNPVLSNHYRVELYSSMKKSLEIATDIQTGVSKSLNLPKTSVSGSVNVGINVNVEKNEYAESHEIMDMQIEFGPFIPKKASAPDMRDATTLPQPAGSNMSTGKLVAIILGAVVVAVGATIAAMKFLLV